MQLTFLGANRQVTGSRYCLEVGGQHIMIDCGLFQERDYLSRNWQDCPVKAKNIAAILLTHIHIDHSGLIPKFVREGFKGPIWATQPTIDLADVVLRDSASIQEEDAAYKRKRHQREGRHGKHPETPLYTLADAERALAAFRAVDYDRTIDVTDSIKVTFRDAGHILGSAMLEIQVIEDGKPHTLLFSGDIGQVGKPLIGDPTYFNKADYVIMESTYGNRNHVKSGDVETQLARVINDTIERGGKVLIPTFAVERAQELMYHLSKLVYARLIPEIPIFLDSPMAHDVTEIYRRHKQYLDEDTQQLIMSNRPPLQFPGLRLLHSTDESKSINNHKGPGVIMAPSGMCTAGRIKHHLSNHIGHPENTVLFVGYQSSGTLGRQILDGRSEVRIHGQERLVRAQVAHINGLSGHADQRGLMHWLKQLKSSPPKQIFLTHGELPAAEALAELIRDQLGWTVTIPEYNQRFELE